MNDSPHRAADHAWRQVVWDLLQEMGDYAILVDRDGTIVHTSSGVTVSLGYIPDELVGRTIFEIIHPEELALAEQRFQEILSTTHSWPGTEIRIRLSSGEYLWHEARGINCLDNPAIGAVVVIVRDISERKQAEEAVRESEIRFKLMSNSAPVLIWVAGPDMRCTWFNNSALEFTGRTLEQEVGDGWIEGIHPDDFNRGMEIFVAAFNARRPFSLELRLRRADGEYRWMLDSGVPRFDDRGQFLGYIGSCIDITEQKELQEKLGKVTREQEIILDTAPLGISLIIDRKQVWVNRKTCELFQYPREELIGHTTRKLYQTQEAYDRLGGEVYPALSQGEVFETVQELVRRDGTKILVRYVGQAIDPCNMAQGTLWVLEDITESQRLVTALIQAKFTAEAANRAKSDFLSTMSHELRTPLNTILGYGEILREGIPGPVTPEQSTILTTIEQSGRHLLSLINDVLDLSRLETANLALHDGPVCVENLCSICLQLIREQAHRKELRVTFSMRPAPAVIRTDQLRLKQILLNLLNNAIKFTPEGGEVELEVAGDTLQNSIRFTVRDTGIGITAEDQARVFQPFIQVDSRLSRQYEGTGLGLALVKRLVTLMEGEVTLVSEPGRGSRFTVTLPCRECSRAEVVDQTDSGSSDDRDSATPPAMFPLLLIADDSYSNNEMMSGYFSRKGFRTVVATTGEEAVALAREHHPKVIIMDIQMPGMSGLEAIRQIRQFPPPDNSITIIALTALAMPGDRERCLDAGATMYLSKPVRLKELHREIAAMLH